MKPHPRYQYKPEDLFLTVFVYIDDWLKPYQDLLPRLGSPAGGTDSTGQQPAQKATYSELQGRTLRVDYCSGRRDPRSTEGRIRWIREHLVLDRQSAFQRAVRTDKDGFEGRVLRTGASGPQATPLHPLPPDLAECREATG